VPEHQSAIAWSERYTINGRAYTREQIWDGIVRTLHHAADQGIAIPVTDLPHVDEPLEILVIAWADFVRRVRHPRTTEPRKRATYDDQHTPSATRRHAPRRDRSATHRYRGHHGNQGHQDDGASYADDQ
jgi:hypothetical protein